MPALHLWNYTDSLLQDQPTDLEKYPTPDTSIAPPITQRRHRIVVGVFGLALAVIVTLAILLGLSMTGIISSVKDVENAQGGVSNLALGVRFPELQVLLDGNVRYMGGEFEDENLSDLATFGQSPNVRGVARFNGALADSLSQVSFIGCSDSRVSGNVLFQSPPGTLFSSRNIANQVRRRLRPPSNYLLTSHSTSGTRLRLSSRTAWKLLGSHMS